MNEVYLGIGGNEGNVLETFDKVYQLVSEKLGSITSRSKHYRTKAWGVEDQPDFVNQVIIVQTNHDPEDVLTHCLSIENHLGRERKVKWGQRIIDIDIIYYNDVSFRTERLIIPHPFMHERNFVLVPLNDVAPNKNHPILNLTTVELLSACSDQLEVHAL